MKISYKWLNEYVDNPFGEKDMVEKLTMAGIEVESVSKMLIPDGVIVAEILERKSHPDAQKLSVCIVSTGTEKLQIVCGASNCNVGIKAPLAMVGTVLEDKTTGTEFKINVCKLRGVESFGMLCSEKELGFAENASGIMELPIDAPVGKPLKEYLCCDIVYDLEITPNRPDLLSHLGIAREVAALSKRKIKFPDIKIHADEIRPAADFANIIQVKDKDLCPQYTARIIENVKVGSSPEWLQKQLKSVGLRPINNIVDITNFVLLELGQPLHAFDLDLLAGKKIIVRKAKDEEKLILLDGSEIKLRSSQLIIADAEKPIALAGVMGGKFSGVTEKTTNILLESAYFKPQNIRKTSRDFGISTDSSYRFERGVDPETVTKASDRATSLILELAGGTLISPLINVCTKMQTCRPIKCRFEKINSLLGINLRNEEIIEILSNLGLEIKKSGKKSCSAVPPSFRKDLKNEPDLAEEIARIYGLSQIPVIQLKAEAGASFREDSYYVFEEAREEFLSLGLDECVNYSMMSEKKALSDNCFHKEDLLVLSNPINQDYAVLRPSLLPGMIENIEYNVSRKNTDLALFEIGRVFCVNPSISPEEKHECCIALSGRKHPERYSSDRMLFYDFYDLKGLIESLFEKRKIKKLRFEYADNPNFERDFCIDIFIRNQKVGVAGKIARRFYEGKRIQNDIFIALINLGSVISLSDSKIFFSQISPYPAVTRDLAFAANSDFEHQKFIDFVFLMKIPYLEKVEIFDEFYDKSLGEGRKSLAYSFTYRNPERTMTDNEINAIHDKIREAVGKELKIELR